MIKFGAGPGSFRLLYRRWILNCYWTGKTSLCALSGYDSQQLKIFCRKNFMQAFTYRPITLSFLNFLGFSPPLSKLQYQTVLFPTPSLRLLSFKAGIHMKAVFWLDIMFLMQISRLLCKHIKNLYAHPTYLCFTPFCRFCCDFSLYLKINNFC